jgi:hypothetical protein
MQPQPPALPSFQPFHPRSIQTGWHISTQSVAMHVLILIGHIMPQYIRFSRLPL